MGINFAPKSVVEEVVQNIRCVLAVRKGSVPLDRDFGLDWNLIDKPIPVAKSVLLAQIFEEIRKIEPRAKVRRVSFEEDNAGAMDGVLKPKISFVIEGAGEITLGTEESDEELKVKIESLAERAAALLGYVQRIDAELEEIEETDYVEIVRNGIRNARSAVRLGAGIAPRLEDVERTDYTKIYEEADNGGNE